MGIISRSADSIKRAIKGALADHADRILWRVADVADEEAVQVATDELVGELGGLDAVVAPASDVVAEPDRVRGRTRAAVCRDTRPALVRRARQYLIRVDPELPQYPWP